jgi:mitosis inhibitor protein kinase SWE1
MRPRRTTKVHPLVWVQSANLLLSSTTPLRQQTLTPLSISTRKDVKSGGVAFDRLAPLSAPRFSAPHSKAETEVYLKTQTKTLTQLSIADLNDSGVAFDDDSGCEVGEDDNDFGDALFLSEANGNPSGRYPKRETLTCKGTDKQNSFP